MARQNITIAGTGAPIRVFDGATATSASEANPQTPPVWVVNFFVQMKHGGSTMGLGYVMTGIPLNVVPNPATSGQLTAELQPATATAPGGNYSQNQASFGSINAGTVDIFRAWVQCSSGDSMILSWDTLS